MGTKISNLLPLPRSVETGNGSFAVKALTISQIALMFNLHRESMIELVVLAQSGSADFAPFIDKFPYVAQDIICLAADVTDAEEREAVASLSGVVQVIALAEIWEATIPDPKRLKVIVENLSRSLKQAAKNLPSETSNVATLEPKKESSMT